MRASSGRKIAGWATVDVGATTIVVSHSNSFDWSTTANNELGVWVTPVICLRNRRRGAFTASKVAIVPYDHLLDWLRAQRNRPVEKLVRFADRL